jgi:hypothetical protein
LIIFCLEWNTILSTSFSLFLSLSSQGKGIMTTYWLNNMDGFNRPLPSADMAASESQHEFK